MQVFLSLNILLALLTVALVYFFWVRPILKETPALKNFYTEEATFFSAVDGKFSGIKQRLTGALLGGSVIIVEMYDTVIPQITGIDVTPITSHFPSWSLPLLSIGGIMAINYFRKLADKAHATELATAQAPELAPAPPLAPTAPVVAPALPEAAAAVAAALGLPPTEAPPVASVAPAAPPPGTL